MKLQFLYLALKEQGPAKRFVRNFFITRNAWGLFSKRSHFTYNGKEKVRYNTKETAQKVSEKMSKKHGKYFSFYRCIFCGGYHLGKNRDNK